MKKLILLAPLLAGCTSLATSAIDPPSKYDYPNKNMQVRYVEVDYIRKVCGSRAEGCAFPVPGKCQVFIRRGTAWGEERVLIHERAHCNGWPGNHPQS